MTKDARIIFRCNNLFREFVYDYCHENKIPVSDFIVLCVSKAMSNKKFKLDLVKKLKKIDIKQQVRELNSDLYFVKNAYKRIMDIAMSNYFTTGSFNMEVVNVMLKNYDKMFKTLDPKIKKLIKDDWDQVKNLSREDVLAENVNKFMKLKAFTERLPSKR